MEIILLLFTFVLAAFLGFELISKVPSQLHTPLMSGSNAISGITIVGALLATGQMNNDFSKWLYLHQFQHDRVFERAHYPSQ